MMWTPQLTVKQPTASRPATAADTPHVAGGCIASATPSRQAGSALILALVTIVMLVMLGAAYLQVARTDRRTAAAVDTRTNQNEGSILRYIGGILAGDIPKEIGDGQDEYYDYPWSNVNVWNPEDQFAPTVIPGRQENTAREPRTSGDLQDAAGLFDAQGGEIDDTWLASIEPNFISGFWPHVTNLQGVLLDLNDIAAANDLVPGGTRLMPAQYLTTADNNFNSGDTNAVPAIPEGTATPAQLGVFADADGDDILDSRWTWAPLPSDGGLAYVMAVRIIDNSALLNISAPSFITSTRLGTPETSRWMWPGELDLESPLTLIKANANGGALTSTQFADQLLTNTSANAGREMGDDAFADRLDHWLSLTGGDFPDYADIGAAIEQNGTSNDNLTDPMGTYSALNVRSEELELRWRGGLNRSDDGTASNAATTLEELDLAMFRDAAVSPPPEQTWLDSTYTASIQEYFEENPRLALTTRSGSANYAQNDINGSSADELAEYISRDFTFGAGTTPTLFTNGGWGSVNNFANQLAAILVDFRDQDSELTFHNGMYGMEYLPFISEVYLQGRYDKSSVTNFPAALPDPYDEVVWNVTNLTTVAGVSTTDAFAIAIELVNPWPWEIDLPDVEVLVLDDLGNTRSWGTLDVLSGQTTMAANEILILTRTDSAAPGGDNTEITNIAGLTGGTIQQAVMPAAPADAWPVGTGTAGIVLAAQSDAGNRVPYQEFSVDELPPTRTDLYQDGQGGAAADEFGYLQHSAFGSGNGLAALTVRDEDVDREVYPTPNTLLLAPTTASDIARANPRDVTMATPEVEFGNDAKAKLSPDRGDNLDERLTLNVGGSYPVGGTPDAEDEPWLIGNAGRFYRTGDLLRAVVIGPRVEVEPATGTGFRLQQLTVAEVWEKFRTNSGSYTITSAMLDLGDGAVVNTSTRNVSHAAYLLAIFTNLESAAGLIPGRPNINTMPERLLATIFPTTNAGTAAAIANEIATARLTPDTAATLNRDPGTQGIQFISQLAKAAAPFTSAYDNTNATSVEVTDFNEYEPNEGGADTANVDGHTDDIEERTRLINYLNQVASTRSDIFTAYVLVRAYPASDFTTQTDEYRLIAVFDRSQVTGDGLPRILAVKRFAD